MTRPLRDLLPFARGEVPADLVIRGARVANVLSLELEEADVAVAGGVVVGVGEGFEARESLDAVALLSSVWPELASREHSPPRVSTTAFCAPS